MSKYFANPDLYARKDTYGHILYEQFASANYLYTFLKNLYPEKNQIDLQELAKKRTDEFIETTPSLSTWQDIRWPIINGDYGRFIMTAGQEDLNKLSNNKGKDFLKRHFTEIEKVGVDIVWDSLKPGKILVDGVVDMSWLSLIHVFKSINNDDYALIWDCS